MVTRCEEVDRLGGKDVMDLGKLRYMAHHEVIEERQRLSCDGASCFVDHLK